jgi:hypothetical protein
LHSRRAFVIDVVIVSTATAFLTRFRSGDLDCRHVKNGVCDDRQINPPYAFACAGLPKLQVVRIATVWPVKPLYTERMCVSATAGTSDLKDDFSAAFEYRHFV